MINALEKRMTSILLKVNVYCDFYSQNRPARDYPAGLKEGAAEFAGRKRITELKYLSKELDTRIKEILDESEQKIIVRSMLEAGVAAEDLVNVPTIKKLKKLIKRGTLKGRDDYELAQWGISAGPARFLDHDEAVALGSLLDEFVALPPKK